jgi:hypothetical protein
MPMISENDEDRRATTLHARHYQNEQEPFKEKSDQIKANAVRISRHAQLIRRSLMPERPTAQPASTKIVWIGLATWRQRSDAD